MDEFYNLSLILLCLYPEWSDIYIARLGSVLCISQMWISGVWTSNWVHRFSIYVFGLLKALVIHQNNLIKYLKSALWLWFSVLSNSCRKLYQTIMACSQMPKSLSLLNNLEEMDPNICSMMVANRMQFDRCLWLLFKSSKCPSKLSSDETNNNLSHMISFTWIYFK